MSNLIKNTNNLKSYINKLIKEKINKTKDKENKKNELAENEIEDLNNKFMEDLFPNKDKIIDETKIDDKHLEKIDDEKINKAVDIIKDLNIEQQKKVLGNLKTKAGEEKNLEKYKKVVKKMKNVLKIDNIINKLSKGKLEAVRKHEAIKSNFTNTPRNIEFDKLSESEKDKKRKKSHELKEEEFLDLAENVLTCVFEEDENKDVPMNKVEKYIDKKEEDENIDKVADIINNLHNNDKENMLHILNDNADNKKKTSILKKLTNKIHKKEHKHKKHKDKDKNKEENNFAYDIIKAFNNNRLNEFVEGRELNDDQLGNFTNDVIGDLFNNNEKQEENDQEKNINKAANVIKDLNKKDQTKVLSYLKENANDENKKEKIEKVNSLVNSMNGIKQYVKGIIKKRTVKDKNNEKKELEKDKLKDLSENMLNDLYEEDKKDDDIEKETPGEEEKLSNMANTLNKLNENDKKKVLNILEENAINDRKQKILNNLKNKVRKINHARILSDNMRIKNDESRESEKEKEKDKEKEKPKLTEEEINDMAYQFSADLYYKEHKPTNSFEDFIMKENKEIKIEEMAESMKKLDKDDQEKALSIINKNAIDDDQKEKAQKLSHLVNNLNNMKSYFGKMIKTKMSKDLQDKKEKNELYEEPLEGDLHEDEIAKITNSFWFDISNSKNSNQVNDIINSFANVIKELKKGDQAKAIKLLKNKTKEENKNVEEINNLEKKINNLNEMKNEIDSYRKSIIFSSLKIPSLTLKNEIKDEDEIPYNKSAENEAPEIIIEELEPMELQQITDDFCADLEDGNANPNVIKPEENENEEAFNSNDENDEEMKITDIANTITKLQENDQKKIIENLEQKVKNDKLPKLLHKIEAINKIKTLSRIIKEKKRKKMKKKNQKRTKLNSCMKIMKKKICPRRTCLKISNAFIKDIFNREKEKGPEKDFHKDYLKEVVKRQKLKKQ